ncbi:MAG: LysR substrate-binding domain-containing protein [Geminicoccaceae bacterium]
MADLLEPELLRSFVAIAETGGFTAAAQRVHRTQSAVSMQIRRLEEQLGAELFQRAGRTVRLSHGGELLLPHARRILQAHREALAAFDREQLAGTVTLGAPDDYASTFLPRSLARFAESHPRAVLDFVCQPSAELVRRLAERTIDLALVTQGYGERGGTLLLRERLVWVASASCPVPEQDPLPLAIYEPGCPFRSAAVEALARAGRAYRIAYTSVSFAGVHAAVDAGLAVTVMLRGSVRPGQRILDARDGFPPLGEAGIVLLRASPEPAPLVDQLEAAITDYFRDGRTLNLAA